MSRQDSVDVTPPSSPVEAAAEEALPMQWTPSPKDRFKDPMPHLDLRTRLLVRGTLFLNRTRLSVESGLEHIAAEHDPFIVVANHSQRIEALLLPSLLFYKRAGKRVHFLADWPMMLVPGIRFTYRAAQVIPVFGKSARLPWRNHLLRFYYEPGTAWERAGEKIKAGGSIGFFPEGTINRRPRQLLRGRAGAARLAIDHNIPVVPIGIKFPQHRDAESIPDGAPMVVKIGAPLKPPNSDAPAKELVRSFQVRIMERISSLSGKVWTPDAPRR